MIPGGIADQESSESVTDVPAASENVEIAALPSTDQPSPCRTRATTALHLEVPEELSALNSVSRSGIVRCPPDASIARAIARKASSKSDWRPSELSDHGEILIELGCFQYEEIIKKRLQAQLTTMVPDGTCFWQCWSLALFADQNLLQKTVSAFVSAIDLRNFARGICSASASRETESTTTQ